MHSIKTFSFRSSEGTIQRGTTCLLVLWYPWFGLKSHFSSIHKRSKKNTRKKSIETRRSTVCVWRRRWNINEAGGQGFHWSIMASIEKSLYVWNMIAEIASEVAVTHTHTVRDTSSYIYTVLSTSNVSTSARWRTGSTHYSATAARDNARRTGWLRCWLRCRRTGGFKIYQTSGLRHPWIHRVAESTECFIYRGVWNCLLATNRRLLLYPYDIYPTFRRV